MVTIDIHEQAPFGGALIQLQPGERFLSESGAMYRASGNIDIDVTTRTRGGGGILKGIKRMLARESFFLSTYSVTDGRTGEVGLAPTLEGDVRALTLDGSTAWLCTGGAFLGADETLELDTRFQGFKGMFSGESLFFLRVAGSGQLLVNAFGRITEVPVDGGLVVDTGHVVAFEETLDYRITKAGGSWVRSMLGGEGLVMHFSGQGRVVVQSHDPSRFGSSVGRRLPRGADPERETMQHTIHCAPGSTVLEVDLAAGESITAESGAMAWMDPGVETETSTRGGILSGLKRKVLTGESFFQNRFTAPAGGKVAFTAGCPGDVVAMPVPDGGLILQRGAYVASEGSVTVDARWAGLRGFLHEGLFAIHCGGSGTVFFSSYGAISQVDVDGEYLVDSGYAVAWEPSLDYRLTRARRIRSFVFGDQLLVRYSGRGRLWMQNRSPQSLADFLHPFRPQKSNND